MILDTSPRLYAYTGGRPFDRRTDRRLHSWRPARSQRVILQSRYLAHHGFSVLAFDLPGHMRSEGPALANVEAMADRLKDGVLAAGADRCCGRPQHGLADCARTGATAARTCGGVALVAAAFPMRVSDALLAATRSDVPQAMDMINVWSHSAALAAFERKPCCPGPGFSNAWQNLRLMQRIARRDGPDVLPLDFAACNSYAGGLDAARALHCRHCSYWASRT